jgi:hypothetical protein
VRGLGLAANFLNERDLTNLALAGIAPDFVEVGEVGFARGDAMRRQRRVQLVG